MKPSSLCLVLLLVWSSSLSSQETKKDDKPNPKDALKEIAGSAEFLRGVPKRFGKLQAVDNTKRSVTIHFDGDPQPTNWTLTPDAEVKIYGWWGRLNDLVPKKLPDDDLRVWAWFKINRANQRVGIFMLADDLSEQDIHGDGLTVKSIDEKVIVFSSGKDKTREALISECTYTRGRDEVKLTELKPGDRVFMVRWSTPRGTYTTQLMDRARFEYYRGVQKKHQRDRWAYEGLPGSVGFLHVYAGEVDVILDHEGMRWGRSLQAGAKVELMVDPPIKAVVKSVTAQREKTQVRLVVRSFDLADLNMGQRVHLKMPAPAKEVEDDVAPPGIEVTRTKEERIDWFLANTYCCCKVGGDGCTGHFYTLASCNPNACAAPNQTRKYIAKKIDDGWTNREIFDAMLKERGPQMLRPHLLP